MQSKGLRSVTVDNKQAHPKHSGESHSMEEKQAQRETQPQGPAPRNLFPSDSLLAASYLQIMALSVSSEPKLGFIQEGALSSTQTTMDTAHITRNVCCLSVVSFFFFFFNAFHTSDQGSKTHSICLSLCLQTDSFTEIYWSYLHHHCKQTGLTETPRSEMHFPILK